MFTSENQDIKNITRKLAPKEFHFKNETLEKNIPFIISNVIIDQICAALNSGKHIIFVGPPGTGKTTIAEAVCQAAYSLSLSFGKGMFTTATSDWTTFDTLGGYMPDVRDSRRLTFSPGIITRAILDGQWLVIDEINRTDIDKAIGPFFSILSNQEVMLPFINSSGQNFSLRIGTNESTDTEYYVHPYWRMIGTMNDFDKSFLYKLSYALLRRFAIIKIPTPKTNEILYIIKAKVPKCNLDKGLSEIVKVSEYRKLGQGIYLDMARYIVSRCADPVAQTEEYTREAVEIYLLPQLEGIPSSIIKNIATIFKQALPGYHFDENKIEFD